MLPASNPSRRVLERIAAALTGERAPRAAALLAAPDVDVVTA